MLKSGFSGKKAKHSRGFNACSYCQHGAHKQCRPRLDGTVCSCSCSLATEMRDHYSRQVAQALDGNLPEPNAIEALKCYRPGRRTGSVKINAVIA